MSKETPLLVITGYDEVSFGDIKRRYPITNDEWKLDEISCSFTTTEMNTI